MTHDNADDRQLESNLNRQPETGVSSQIGPNAAQNELPTGPVASESPREPSVISRLFRGPNGIRALWRLLIFLAITFVFQFLVRVIVRAFVHGPRTPQFTPVMIFFQDGTGLLIILLAAAIMSRIEGRPLGAYGLPGRGAFGPLFLEGLVWGFLAESATILILFATGNARFNGFDQHGGAALYHAVMWALAFLLVGFFEEFLFRGYPQFTISTGIGFWPAACILSGMFWLGHMGNPGETWIGGLATALIALAFCLSLWLTGNLWFAVGMHAAFDWAETYFFGVPDSGMPASGHLMNTTLSGSKWMTGGTVGPEGSIVQLILIFVLMALLFLRFRRRTGPALSSAAELPQARASTGPSAS